MSTICAQSIKLSGLAENLEVFYYKIKEVVLINQDSYHTLFDSIQDVEDWGSEWMILHTKEYEIGHSMMRIDCDSEWEPADGFWKKISKDFDVVIEIEYANPDLEYFYSTFYSDGKLLKSERITYLEHLYFTDYKSFWREIVERTSPCSSDLQWSSFEEVVQNLEGVIPFLKQDELKLLQDIYDKKYDKDSFSENYGED